jgi:hypothetical protein
MKQREDKTSDYSYVHIVRVSQGRVHQQGAPQDLRHDNKQTLRFVRWLFMQLYRLHKILLVNGDDGDEVCRRSCLKRLCYISRFSLGVGPELSQQVPKFAVN